VGQEYSHVFVDTDNGPWYDSGAPQYDTLVSSGNPNKNRQLTKKEIYEKLKERNIAIPQKGFVSKAELVQFSNANQVPTKELLQVREGWVGKPKGMKQVLWERGMLDPEKYNLYTKNGPTDEDGITDLTLSYTALMSNLEDFRTETTVLHDLGEKLGVLVVSTPKYHAKIAGEGIEYIWALTKNWFKRQPLSDRKTWVKFKALVTKALSSKMVSEDAMRSAGRRARSYILAYLYLHNADDETEEGMKLFDDIEKTAKHYRSHRGPSNQQSGFLEQLYKETFDNEHMQLALQLPGSVAKQSPDTTDNNQQPLEVIGEENERNDDAVVEIDDNDESADAV
jgi:hypothetical protein